MKTEKPKNAPSEVKARLKEILEKRRQLDAEVDAELASLKAGLLALKQEVINKLADKPASEKN